MNNYNKFLLILFITLSIFLKVYSGLPTLDPESAAIHAVRFDASYYYDMDQKVEQLSDALVSKWNEAGINTIYFKAYDPAYGAKYRTKYELNQMADYGRKDLLKAIIQKSEERGMKVIAWIPAFQHKNVWDNHPDWRVKNADGSDYQPAPESYFLCPAHPGFRKWWLGFIEDILENYSGISGIDIAEPIISWNSPNCYCEQCLKETELSSSQGMTRTIRETIALVKKHGKISSVTSIATPAADGSILPFPEQKKRTGFDLNAVLDGTPSPDWLNMELMWQQWSYELQMPQLFTPEWTSYAAETVQKQVDRRARLIAHLELTSFYSGQVSTGQFLNSVRLAKEAGIEDIDIYDTNLLDEEAVWADLKPVLEQIPVKKVLVSTDSLGENDARQVATLVSHFHTEVTLDIGATLLSAPETDPEQYDAIFWVGVDPKFSLTAPVLEKITSAEKVELVWINYGLNLLLDADPQNRWDITYLGMQVDSSFRSVIYKDFSLPKTEPVLHRVSVGQTEPDVLAWAVSDSAQSPYVVRSHNLWYFADLPTSFVIEGGRHIVFAELLHDILKENHKQKKLALVRIEDIHPLTDPESLTSLAGYLKSNNIPFAFAVVPFYLDPVSNTTVALSDRPELVSALHQMVESGGTLVMHGVTHQYRGETTADYEFWDQLSGGPIFEDSEHYISQRLETGLAEFQKNGLFPVVWETPHYGASQMDYEVINRYFSTAYERRQTINLHGSDQLLPYLVYQHTSGGKIIPENLGYVPLSDPDPQPIVTGAYHNLAIRDAVASFFFHPFVDHGSLKEIISGLRENGYTFTSIRSTSNRVTAPGFVLTSNSDTVSFSLNHEYVHTFFLEPDGNIHRNSYSDSLISGNWSDYVEIPNGWLYIAESTGSRPETFMEKLTGRLSEAMPDFVQDLFQEEPKLHLAENFPLKPAILINENAEARSRQSQENMIKALQLAGTEPEIIPLADFLAIPDNINLLIVPFSAAQDLNEQQKLFIIRDLQNGMNMVFENFSELTEDLGIYKTGIRQPVHQITDTYFPQVDIQWNQPDTVSVVDVDIDYVTYYEESKSETPLIIGGEYGAGKYLYIASYFDPVTDWGYARYPYFLDVLKRQFKLVPVIRARNLDIYFEPGSREDISTEELVKMWRQNGVKNIYVSAWHFYDNYTYDYARLIELAHQNAMLVYAWLEIPHVSDKFWNEHPEWHEITAAGTPAIIDWRKNMAVSMPECREEIFRFLEELILSYEWDGINLAELYFESPDGYSSPEKLTPMNAYVRKEFKELHGFDPAKLFDKTSSFYWRKNSKAVDLFNRYRTREVVELHREFMELFHKIASENHLDLDLMVTTIEDQFSGSTAENIGVDTRQIADVAKTYPFSLQIEDPQNLWSLGPGRYEKLREVYGNYGGENPTILDINVVPFRAHASTVAPTHQPSGLELLALTSSAAEGDGSVAFYSESSIYEVDFPILQFTMAQGTEEQLSLHQWKINNPSMVSIFLNRELHESITVDGEVWPAYYQGHLILPPGAHTIQPVSAANVFLSDLHSSARLVDISGELLSISAMRRGIEFRYRSRHSNFVVLNQEPKSLKLNGNNLVLPATKGAKGYLLRLPAGEHQVTVYTRTTWAYILQIASILISGLIVLIGVTATVFLTVMYLRMLFRRRPVLLKQPE